MRAIGAPRRYVQGPGAIGRLPEMVAGLGARPFLVADPVAWQAEGAALAGWLEAPRLAMFGGEITAGEIDRLASLADAARADAVVAFGGGKAIDAAKGVALAHRLPIAVVPSVASNDAPTSRLIVVYDDAHRIAEVRRLPDNPALVLADTAIIARAPRRFLAAGIGDALSKLFEATACDEAGGLNFHAARPPLSALALARCCYETIRRDAIAALRSVDRRTPDGALENVVEACIYMSGVGFESGGLSLAHALTRGFTAHPATSRALHGETVAFGTIAQLVQQGHGEPEIRELIAFCRACGLPTSFAALGIADVRDEDLRIIAGPTLEAPYIGHLRSKPDLAGLVAVLRRCDELGRGST